MPRGFPVHGENHGGRYRKCTICGTKIPAGQDGYFLGFGPSLVVGLIKAWLCTKHGEAINQIICSSALKEAS